MTYLGLPFSTGKMSRSSPRLLHFLLVPQGGNAKVTIDATRLKGQANILMRMTYAQHRFRQLQRHYGVQADIHLRPLGGSKMASASGKTAA